jgi:hypothetical protein
MSEQVVKPSHYNQGSIECIDYLKDVSSTDEYHGFLINNVRKYLHRYKGKNGLNDLQKAQWYLNKLVEELNGQDQGQKS